MHQPIEYTPTPLEVDVDGHVDRLGIRYIGIARRKSNGKYISLADVGGALCLVEVALSFDRVLPSSGEKR